MIYLKGNKNLVDDTQELTIEVQEPHGLNPSPLEFSFETLRFLAPSLELFDFQFATDDGTNIAKKKPITASLRIYNTGEGTAEDVDIIIEYPLNIVPIEPVTNSYNQVRFNFPVLPAGSYKDLKLRFIANDNYFLDSIKLELVATEMFQEYGFKVTLGKPLNSRSSTTSSSVAIKSIRKAKAETINPVRLVSEVDEDLPDYGISQNHTVAVVIGNRDYYKTSSVDYAINDSRVFRNYLMQTFGLKNENIIYLENATQADFRNTFGSESDHRGKLYNLVDESIENLIVYYSGHGAPDLNESSKEKTGYFVPVDCDPNLVSLSGYSSETKVFLKSA
jgi:hypothetical protein